MILGGEIIFNDLRETDLYELYAGAGIYDLFYYIGKGAAKVCELMRDNMVENKYVQPLYGNW